MSVFSSNQHFAMNPVSVDLKRSTFDRSNTHKTTFDSGKLVPIFLDEVLPGDTFNLQYSYVCRLATPLYPTMDTANLDIYFFFVPTRIIWSDFQKFMGENDKQWITDQQEIFVPQIVSTTVNNNLLRTGYNADDLAAYFGVPIGVKIIGNKDIGLGINALPFRAYAKIWNDWFRDQNTQQTIFYNTNSTDLDFKNWSESSSDSAFYQLVQYGKGLAPVNKYQDYFTSCLPGPQKGQPVTLPLTGNASLTGTAQLTGKVPVISDVSFYGSSDWSSNPFNVLNATGGALKVDSNNYIVGYTGGAVTTGLYNGNPGTFVNPSTIYHRQTGDFGNAKSTAAVNTSGLNVDLSNVTAVNVNELRQAFAIQRLLEKDARGGTRYIEIIRSHFGVISPDARLQRSEYLGGGRNPIVIEQVLQTSSTNDTSPLGQTGAFSLTADRNNGFVKSFTEHGYIIGLCCVRVQHTYAQGLSKLWKRFRKYDYYWPALANIGEQPVYKQEIYYTDNTNVNSATAVNTQVFGYNEAWADYRYKLNQVSGLFNPKVNQSLKSWTYVDDYSSAPTLSNSWIQENKSNIQQTIAVQNQPQFIADFYFRNKATRPMPVYSVPGLIDHN